ncbi:MAG: metal ABC transporter permease, partial [Gemmatimonadota bacterium]
AARNTAQAFWGAIAVALVSGLAGIAASYSLDTATGATVVLFAAAIFAATAAARRLGRAS